jgi:hypothetical protein
MTVPKYCGRFTTYCPEMGSPAIETVSASR